MLTWKSNKEYPNDDEHEVFVISKAYGFCGLLYYQDDNFNDNPDFEPYVENDECELKKLKKIAEKKNMKKNKKKLKKLLKILIKQKNITL